MKKSAEEQLKLKLQQAGNKNRLCGVLIEPILAISMRFFRVFSYLKGNVKRFFMLAMTFFLFAVYSSFSFPIFIRGDKEAQGETKDVMSEAPQDIMLAEEVEINLEEIELLDDADVLMEDEQYAETSHGMDIVARYSALDILESNQSYTSLEKPSKEVSGDYEFSEDDWRIVLINKQNSIPDDYEVKLGVINTIKGPMQCDERIINDMLDMFKAAQEEGIVLEVCSPYRDFEYQQMLFNRKIKRYMNKGMSYMEAYKLSNQVVTVPGASEHQLGLALDLVTTDYVDLDQGFADTDAGKWLAANSYRYGFILRYPLGKEYITGIEYEPWHFRYVGVEAATVITQQGITLEEFWEDYL